MERGTNEVSIADLAGAAFNVSASAAQCIEDALTAHIAGAPRDFLATRRDLLAALQSVRDEAVEASMDNGREWESAFMRYMTPDEFLDYYYSVLSTT